MENGCRLIEVKPFEVNGELQNGYQKHKLNEEGRWRGLLLVMEGIGDLKREKTRQGKTDNRCFLFFLCNCFHVS